jgi:hypothetical protein
LQLDILSALPSITTSLETTCDKSKFAEFIGVSPQSQLKEVLFCEFTNGVFGSQKPDVLQQDFEDLDVSPFALEATAAWRGSSAPAKTIFNSSAANRHGMLLVSRGVGSSKSKRPVVPICHSSA